PLLLHNETAHPGHWIGLRLTGTGRSNRDAYGAVVTIRAGAWTFTRTCRADGSYLSSSDPRLLCGLGSASRVDSITLRWPDGRIETRIQPPVDRYQVWIEGRGP